MKKNCMLFLVHWVNLFDTRGKYIDNECKQNSEKTKTRYRQDSA